MSSTSSEIFRCINLNHSYRMGNTECKALENLNLGIRGSEISCLTGPSGSGKSTLLRILGLIEPLQNGEVVLFEKQMSKITEKDKNEFRRFRLGFVFQNFILFEALTALENVEYFLKNRPLTKNDRRMIAMDALKAVGLESMSKNLPMRMSGGQRQRVAIARALAKAPQVILADEPTASLDQTTGREIMEIFSYLVDKNSLTVVMASHDSMAISYANTVISLKDGKLTKGSEMSRGTIT